MKKMKRFIFILIGIVVVCITAYFLFFSGDRSNFILLEDDEIGIKVEYPSGIFVATTTTAYIPPEFEKRYEGPALMHAAPYEHCDLSGLPGSCTPTTKDIRIGFFKIARPFAGIKDALQSPDMFGNLVQPVTLADREGVVFESGAEGEGVFYYFLPLDASHTLVVTRNFINEESLLLYKNASGFIPYAEQGKLFDEVIDTLEFQSR